MPLCFHPVSEFQMVFNKMGVQYVLSLFAMFGHFCFMNVDFMLEGVYNLIMKDKFILIMFQLGQYFFIGPTTDKLTQSIFK